MFDWIVSIIAAGGYFGLAALMAIENVFPPIPSELIMPLAGFQAAKGEMSPVLAVLAGTFGSVLGGSLWYWLGLRLGLKRLRKLAKRHGRWLTVGPEDIDRANAWFHRHGEMAVFFGRMLPGFRTLISVPAGIAKMPLVPFLAWSTAGSLVWIGGLTALGYLLEANYDRVAGWLDPVTWVVIGAAVLGYVSRLLRGKGRARKA
ncbi:DedA family protein [Jannaschia sp. W003]|uniref:DedA family protein n=1 Tax=Jannaschia sp. W003 TaxID=2867012 RepID=UPI0021A96C6E|nr:DedA family protein [Jannaschia sp. W003]UWQ21722.1 DedA family protein [Jannaschia sp. W003]